MDGLTSTVVMFVDRDERLIELRIAKDGTLPDRMSLILCNTIPKKPLPESIFNFVTKWAEDSECHLALADPLARRTPRLSGGATLDDPVNGIRHPANSTICTQGPSGMGTTIATEMILALISKGRRVGAVANGHQVVLNLMERTLQSRLLRVRDRLCCFPRKHELR